MPLRLLPHDQGIEAAAGQGGLKGHRAHQGVGAEGEPRHRHRLWLDQLQHLLAQQGQAEAAEAHRLAIHIVIAAAAGSQGELAVAVGPLRQQPKQQSPAFDGVRGKGNHGKGRHGG